MCFSVQLQNQGRQQGINGKVRATVAPLPPSSTSSSMGPPPAKASRPPLSFLGSSIGRPRAPVTTQHDGDDDNEIIQ